MTKVSNISFVSGDECFFYEKVKNRKNLMLFMTRLLPGQLLVAAALFGLVPKVSD